LNVWNVVRYEVRRAVARRKVITLVLITVFFEVGSYVLLTQAHGPRFDRVLVPLKPYLWLLGVLLPQSLLIHFIAISIASGSMAEEYEQGTVDFFLTKPIGRGEFLLGKFLGGFLLLVSVYALMVVLALSLSFLLFGTQRELNYLPEVVGTVVFSSLTFFTISFLVGELSRRSSISFLASSSFLVGSLIVSILVVFLSQLVGMTSLEYVTLYLPTWGASQLPFIVSSAIPGVYLIVEALSLFPLGFGSAMQAIASILVYSSVASAIALYSFARRDVPKRVY